MRTHLKNRPVDFRRLRFAAAAIAGCVFSAAAAVRATPGGFIGGKAAALFENRLVSAKARGDVFAETVNAFRTRYDDLHADPSDAKRHFGYWQGEYWGKTMLSHCAWQRLVGDADGLAFIRREALALVDGFQRPDGFLGTYADEDFIVGWNWNVWGRKYTLWALVEAYDLTGERRLLDAARRMVEQLDEQLTRKGVCLAETGCFAGLPSMSILKPLVLLYERTGDPVCRKLARAIVTDNDRADGRRPNLIANAFSDRPVRTWYPESWEWAKAYEFMSCVEGFVEYARVMKEPRPLEAAKRLFAKLTEDEANPLGSVGYHDKFVGAAHRPNAISEVCDVVHWMRLCRILYESTGDDAYLDQWERCFHNAFLAGIFRDGTWGMHDVRSHGRRHLQGLYEVNMIYHFCCIDNAPRAFADWFGNAVVVRAENTFDVNFYEDGHYAADGVEIAVAGNYPVGDKVRVTVTSPRDVRLRLRIPDWATGMTVDGRAVRGRRCVIEAKAGVRAFALDFAMAPRVEVWRGGDLAADEPALAAYLSENFEMWWHDPEMKGLARKTCGVRVIRGPLVLAKCQRVGDDDATCLTDLGVDATWKVSATPLPSRGTWGCWEVSFEKDGVRKTVHAGDYASAADSDDWHNAFSIWF